MPHNAADLRLVYRLEDDTGEGAFQAISWDDMDAFQRCHQVNGDARRFPVPPNDPGFSQATLDRSGDNDWRLGCRSLDQLREWFPPAVLPILERNGVVFTIWAVCKDKVAFGRRQVLFERASADCIKRLPLSAIYA